MRLVMTQEERWMKQYDDGIFGGEPSEAIEVLFGGEE